MPTKSSLRIIVTELISSKFIFFAKKFINQWTQIQETELGKFIPYIMLIYYATYIVFV